MAHSSIKYWCHDCRVMFSVYWTPYHKKPFCPKCGDGITVRRYPYIMTPPDKVGTRPRWGDDEPKLIELYNKTDLTSVEIGKRLNRTNKAIRNKLNRLRKEGRIL